MINFGKGWIWESGLLSHMCGPELSAPWSDRRNACACGEPVPRHARSFQRWINRELRRSASELKSVEFAGDSVPPVDPQFDRRHL